MHGLPDEATDLSLWRLPRGRHVLTKPTCLSCQRVVSLTYGRENAIGPDTLVTRRCLARYSRQGPAKGSSGATRPSKCPGTQLVPPLECRPFLPAALLPGPLSRLVISSLALRDVACEASTIVAVLFPLQDSRAP
ncbi:hypothetical protein E2C01_075057 [Portunus trituberculatus]|uniref:Uncharacterized protein n=1 Tax=Portunus trituberculatus TaxID=210409 RepID=A0A5B7IFW6_PORTR|nr:hypothetical protein [Portunus trituberculatus]